jgi:protein-tyrosine sulfotransferase
LSGSQDFLFDLKKYFNYFFETRGFSGNGRPGATSERVTRADLSARGETRRPAIFIHGIMPRSGTVYAGELLRLHPDLNAYPNNIWEFPALTLTEDILKLQAKFMEGYRINRDKFEKEDFLSLFGSALLSYLHDAVPSNQRVLVKMPSVQYLNYFFSMFPYENLLILLRDGRDLVHSTIRTWKQLNFVQVCLRWNRSAQMVKTPLRQFEERDQGGYWVAKYEDALREPAGFVREACRRFKLDENRYPFDRIGEIRVIGSSKLEKAGEVSWQHLEKPKDFKPTEYWSRWSVARKLVFKAIAGGSLIDLDYSKDLKW